MMCDRCFEEDGTEQIVDKSSGLVLCEACEWEIRSNFKARRL